MLHSPGLRTLFHIIFPLILPRFPSFQRRLCSTSSSILDLCTNSHHLQQIHARFILHGLHQNPALSSKLMDCYANFGIPTFSKKVFHFTDNPDSVILHNLSQFGSSEKTLLVYKEMIEKSMYPDEDGYNCLLSSCFCLSDEHGKMISGNLLKLGIDAFDFLGGTLIEMCDKACSFVSENERDERNYMTELNYWNGLISEAFQSGHTEESLRIFDRMRQKKLQPNSLTVINLLRSTVDLECLKIGRVLHSLVVVFNLCDELSVNTALLSMYAKLGSLEDARLLFEKMPERDSVVWNIMISAYSRNGRPKESLELLSLMVRSGVRADLFTAIPAISSVTQLKLIEWGKQMHAYVIRSGSDYQASVDNSLINMYSECNHLNSAQKTFDLITNKTVVSWSAMIKGYVMHDQCLEALSLFSKMKLNGTRVDFIIVINTLPACANIGALENVRYLHGYSLKTSLDSLRSVKTSLLSTYAKCGCIEMARKLFDEEKGNHKDLIGWNSMISAYAKHGEWFQCFQLYNQMKLSNIIPDQVTFLGLLTACVNSGLIEEGKEIFTEMKEIYNYQPSQEHHACMVDLLGRAGHINEAREIIKTMTIKPDARIWGPLLSACKMHSETHFAEIAAEKLINMEPKNAGNYVLLSNIYAASGKWDRVAKMRSFLQDRGLKKTPGCSWLEFNGLVHEFRVADQSHIRSQDIYAALKILELEIQDMREKTFETFLDTLIF